MNEVCDLAKQKMVLVLDPKFDIDAVTRASNGSIEQIGSDSLYLMQDLSTNEFRLVLIRDHWQQGAETGETKIIASCEVPGEIASDLQLKYGKDDSIESNERPQAVPCELEQLLAELSGVNHKFELEVFRDLNEVRGCLKANALRAALSMCGRVLELSLKQILHRNQIAYQSDWMVGRLLQEIETAGIYLDKSLKNTFNIIKEQRNCGIHHNEGVPIPSRNQVLGVIHHVCDTVERARASS